MSHRNGIKNFSFIPETYIMPKDYNRFVSNQYRHRGLWIIKPFDLSRGRGITIIDYVIIIIIIKMFALYSFDSISTYLFFYSRLKIPKRL